MSWFFLKNFFRNIFHSKKWEMYFHKCILVFMSSTRYSSQSLMKLEFSRQISKNFFNIKFHKNQSNGNRVVLCWRTDGQRDYENNIIFLQFCEAHYETGFKQKKTTDNTHMAKCYCRSVGAVTRSCARQLTNCGLIPGREKTFFSPNPPASTVDCYSYEPNVPAISFYWKDQTS